MPTPPITRPNEKAIFAIATAGVLLATTALFVAPGPTAIGGEEPAAEVGTGAESRPASRPTSGPASKPAAGAAKAPAKASVPKGATAKSPTVPFPSEYRDILERVVGEGTVDYAWLAGDGREALDAVVGKIASADFDTIEAMKPAARDAWWINAYNVLTLNLIVQHYPIESIMKIDQAWETPMDVAGRKFTLNDIEHKLLRHVDATPEVRADRFDPRVHFAVNCASVGCPDLQPEPFTAMNLERLYDAGVRRFMEREDRFRFADFRFETSDLLNWYGDDFVLGAGDGLEEATANVTEHGAPESDAKKIAAVGIFFSKYERDPDAAAALAEGHYEHGWLGYDWALNDAPSE